MSHHIYVRPLILTALLSLGGLIGCNDSGGSGGSSGPAELETTTMLRGRVVDLEGNPLEGVEITLAGETMTTAANGRYAFETASTESTVVKFSLGGYMKNSRRTRIVDGHPTVLDMTLRPLAEPVLIDATMGGEAAGMRGAAIVAPAGAFVDASGAPVQGMIDVRLTAIDPTIEAELASAPGDLSGSDSSGEPVLLESFGMLDVTLSQGEQDLQVADGMQVEIRIPAPDGVDSPPETMPLWHFNEESGEWEEQGTLTWSADEKVYVGQVSHFSTWNADQPAEATCITGFAKDEHDRPLAGAAVAARGVDYSGRSTATTLEDGRFYIAVRKNSEVSVLVSHREGGGEARVVTSGGADTAVPPRPGVDDCLDVGEWTVQRDVYRGPDGVSVACDDTGNPLAGTCVEPFFNEFSQCFQPAGECTYSQDGQIRYGNGARVDTSYDQSGAMISNYRVAYYGPGGRLCARGESVGDISANSDFAFDLTLASGGGAYRISSDPDSGSTTITCPNGDSVTLDTEAQERLEACTGGDDGAEDTCTFEGQAGGPGGNPGGNPGGMGGACTNNSECSGGTTCCTFTSGDVTAGICLDAQVCAQVQANQGM